jgi:CubicO group peptidase (beta-lactamase class C family)
MKRLSLLAGFALPLPFPTLPLPRRRRHRRADRGNPPVLGHAGHGRRHRRERQGRARQGYGERRLGAPAKVDADTIFMIGSTGKALTAAALATLVDAGKIGWDDKVVDHIPDFQMYDAWVTREMTIRDLLVHRSGLGLGAETCSPCRAARSRATT